MYVCICKAISDTDIKQAVNEGAYSLACLSKELGVATGCGQCAQAAESLLQETLVATNGNLVLTQNKPQVRSNW